MVITIYSKILADANSLQFTQKFLQMPILCNLCKNSCRGQFFAIYAKILADANSLQFMQKFLQMPILCSLWKNFFINGNYHLLKNSCRCQFFAIYAKISSRSEEHTSE